MAKTSLKQLKFKTSQQSNLQLTTGGMSEKSDLDGSDLLGVEPPPRSPKRGKFDHAISEKQHYSESSTYPSDPDSSESTSLCDSEVESMRTLTESSSSESTQSGWLITVIAAGLSQKPVQPVDISFPVRKIGKSNRGCNPLWFKTYPWMEYSVEKDAIFCYPCRHFATNSGRSEKSFTQTRFRD